jgi:hypothetical protein
MKKLTILFLALAAVAFAVIPGPAPFFNSAVSNTAVLAKSSPCYLAGYNASNTNSTAVYLQFFDIASAGNVTVGTTAPVMVLAIPGNGVIDGVQVSPVPFQNGVVIAATTTPTGSTAPSSAVATTLIFK